MPAGFRIWGDHGFVQIDSDYSNMGFVQGGTLNLTPGSVFGFIAPMVTATLTVNGTAPIVALNGAGIFVNQYATTRNGDQWTFYFRASSSTPIQVSYWVYDVANRALGASAPEGFRIFDAYGVMTCHGGMDPLKVVDFVNLGAPPDGWSGTSQEGQYITSRTYDGSRTYAVIQSSLCRRQEDWTAANQFDYAVQPGNHMKERRILYSASRSGGSTFEFALATGESRIFESPLSNPDTGYTNGSLAWLVVDVSGLGTAPPVNDVTPNAISWPNASFVTNDNYGSVNTEIRTISGIAQSITLRATVFPSNDTFYDGNVRAYVNGQLAGSHRHSWNGSSVGSFEFDVTSGAQIYFQMDGSTASRRASGNAIVRVQNMSDGGVVLNEFGFSGVVDNDDNYNYIDYDPNPPGFVSMSLNTNADNGFTSASFGQFTGISHPISLRAGIYDRVGSMNSGLVYVFKSTSGSGGPWTLMGTMYTDGTGAQTVDFTVANTDWVYFHTSAATISGRKDLTFNINVFNLTKSTTLDINNLVAQVPNAITVDADNDFNVFNPDYSATPLSFPNLSFNTADSYGSASSFHVLGGTNMPISVRVHVYNLSRTMSDGYLYLARSADGYQFGKQNYSLQGGAGYFDAVLNPGESFFWYADGNTTSGVRTCEFDAIMYNLSDGNAVIGSFHVSGVVDNNNDFGVDLAPDAISFPYISAFQPGDDPVVNGSATYTLTGFNQAITMRAYMGLTYYSATANASSDPFEPNMQPSSGITTMFVVKNGAVIGNTPHFTFSGTWTGQEYYHYLDFTASPGDTIQFITHYHIDGLGFGNARSGAIAGNIYLDSLSGGNRLGQFGHDSTFSTA